MHQQSFHRDKNVKKSDEKEKRSYHENKIINKNNEKIKGI